MTTSPFFFAVTTPFSPTAAIFLLEDFYLTDLLSALAGLTLTERVCVSPARMDEEPVILIFFTFTPLTVTSHWVVLPLEAMAVIIALPGATAVTLPLELTVATLALEDF